MIYLIKIIIFLLIYSSQINSASLENNVIIFKINNKAFTNIDLERRIRYIELVNNLDSNYLDKLNTSEILDDYITSLIFYEYYIIYEMSFNNLLSEINLFYEQEIQIKDKKKNLNEENIQYLKKNIKIDLIRNKILENILNSRKNKLLKKADSLDLIYNYNVSYLIFKEELIDITTIEKITNRLEFNSLKNNLIKNNQNFLYKTEDINDNSLTSNLLKDVIYNNLKIYHQNNDGFITLISLEKNLESHDGIYVKLINYTSEKPLKEMDLTCRNLEKLFDIDKTIYKEYEYSKLNNQIKNNLKSVDDYIIINDNNIYNYIFLCELKYDEKLLNDINFKKNINSLVEDIQINFLKKYKNEFNFQKIK